MATIDGDNNDNVLTGGIDDDIINGNGGNDTITGGQGNDQLFGGDGADTYLFSMGDGQDTIDNFNTFNGNASDIDRLTFTDYAFADATFSIVSNTGAGADDLIISFANSDSVTILNALSNDNRSNIDFIDFTDQSLDTQQLRDIIINQLSTVGDDTITGFGSDDIISALGGNDTIVGNGGNDIITGGTGNDIISGGDGADTYLFAMGDGQDEITNFDSFNGGASDVDRLTFTDYAFADATFGRAAPTGAGADDLVVSFANSDSVTLINGLSSDNRGNIDFIDFTDQSLDVQAIRNLLFAQEATAGDDTITGFGSDDIISALGGNDTIVGNSGNDTITGGTGNDIISGGDGADTYLFAMGDGQDEITNIDTFNGGATDIDRLTFTDYAFADATFGTVAGAGAGSDDLVISFTNGDSVTLIDGLSSDDRGNIDMVDFTDSSLDTEALRLIILNNAATPGDDTITGFGSDDTIDGLAGNDTIIGGSGDDILIGNTGNDDLSGGDGADTFIFNMGDGQDTVTNFDTFNGGASDIDRVTFNDYALVDATITIDTTTNATANTLIISFANGDQVTINEGASGDDRGNIDFVDFTDVTLSTQELRDIAHVNAATNGADTLIGTTGSDNIDGLDNDDFIDGRGGNDILMGGLGNDTIFGGDGADTLVFSSGDGQDTFNSFNTFNGGSADVDGVQFTDHDLCEANFELITSVGGNSGVDDLQITFANGDSVIWFDGLSTDNRYAIDFIQFDLNDEVLTRAQIQSIFTFSATQLADSITGTAGDDVIVGLGGNDTLLGGDGDDNISGHCDNDFIFGEAGNDELFGDAGSDDLRGGTGNDTLWGGDDNDTLRGGDDDDTLNGDAGNDMLQGDDGNDTLNGGDDGDSLFGQDGDDTLNGDGGNDNLQGGVGADTINGGDGDDEIFDNSSSTTSNTDNDVLSGDAGNDHIRSFGGSDTIDGGSDFDRLTLRRTDATANLIYVADLAGSAIAGDGTTIQGIEVFNITTGSGDDDITTLDEADSITLGAGNDTAHGAGGNDFIFGEAGNDELFGDAGSDDLRGGTGNDTLWGGDDNDTLRGGDDDDTLNGDAGNDMLQGDDGNDTLNGGDDGDSLFGQDGDDTLNGDGGNDNLQGGVGADTINGGDGDDEIFDNSSSTTSNTDNDVLSGDAGNDHIRSFGGSDTIDGGSDFDRLTLRRTDATANLIYVADLAGSAIAGDGTTIQGIEVFNITTGSGDDDITTLDEADSITLGAGNDTAHGAGGNDFIFGEAGNDELFGDAGSDDLRGGTGNDTLWGGDDNDTLRGGDDDDTLNGDAGNDTLQGDDGNDTLNGGDDGDSLFGQDGDDTLNGDGGNDNLQGGVGADTINGGDGDDEIFDNSSSTTSNTDNDVLSGDAGNDHIRSFGGSDTIDGGSDFDRLTLRRTDATANLIYVADLAGSAIAGDGTTIQGIEVFNITTGSGDDDITTLDEADSITLGAGNDTAHGAGGNDFIFGEAGNDELFGDAGSDDLRGGTGNDTLWGGDDNDTLRGGDDDDTLNGDAGNDTLQGDDGNDTLNGGDDGDSLFGQDGDDTLNGDGGNDNLQGGTGADRITGGDGNDQIYGLSSSSVDSDPTALDVAMYETSTPEDGMAIWQGSFAINQRLDIDTTSSADDEGIDRLRFIDRIEFTGAADDGGDLVFTVDYGVTDNNILVLAQDDVAQLGEAGGTANGVAGNPTTLTATNGYGLNVLENDYNLDENAIEGDIEAVISAAWASSSETGTGSGNTVVTAGGVTINGALGQLTIDSEGNYTYVLNSQSDIDHLALGAVGFDTFNYMVDDGSGNPVTATLRIEFVGANDAPVVAAALTAAADEDSIGQSINMLDGASDVDDGAVLSVTNISGLASGVTFDGTQSIIVNPSDATFQSLNVGQTSVITVTYDVMDEHGATVAQSLEVTITGTNDTPVVAAALTAAATEDGAAASVDMLDGASDIDNGAILSVTNVGTLPSSVSFDGTQTLTLDPSNSAYQSLNLGDMTDVIVSYEVTDEHGATVPQTVTFTITGTNDAPSVTGSVSASIGEDDADLIVDLLGGASDIDNGAVLSATAISVASGNGVGVTQSGNMVSIDTDSYQYLAVDETEVITLNYTVEDEHGASVNQTAVVTVTGANDAPIVSANVTGSGIEDGTAITVDLLANASDVDASDTLSIANVTGWSAGVTIVGTSLTLDPTDAAFQSLGAGEIGTYFINYDIVDGNGGVVSTTAAITVTGTNDTPVAGDVDLGNTAEDTAIAFTADDLLTNSTDVDGDDLEITLVTVDPAFGTIVFGILPGTYLFVPNADFNGDDVEISFSVSDGEFEVDGTATIDVTPVNDDPVASGDSGFETDAGVALVIDSADLLGNDSDIDGDDLVLVSVAAAIGGTVALVDGSVVYTPVGNFHGDASFTYTVSDGEGGTATATVFITVNNTPTEFDDMLMGTEIDDVIDGLAGDDFIEGLAGDDLLEGGLGRDTLIGGDGIDTLNGGEDGDVLRGDDGDDIMNGGAGRDRLLGGNGENVMQGGDGVDVMIGGNDNDTMFGGNQSDRMYGQDGDDVMDGEGSSDIMRGGAGDDIMTGGLGNDLMMGGDDNDQLFGGEHRDMLWGGNGADLIDGGDLNDMLWGGTGSGFDGAVDTFVFANNFGTDRIMDFEDGIDLIDFSDHTNINSFADVLARTTEDGGNLLIATNATNTLIIENFTLAELDDTDFIF